MTTVVLRQPGVQWGGDHSGADPPAVTTQGRAATLGLASLISAVAAVAPASALARTPRLVRTFSST
ncbi:hypothetical protein [Micromonospora andamanensis]|uniref:hypothetical protein n=2 Tax=Micromonospora andamanensis TaxID=1287068 RepID=UPI00363735AF